MDKERLYLQTDSPSESVLLESDRVKTVGETRPEGVPRLDCRAARVIPGFVNAHTHLYSGLAPFGMPAPEPRPQNFLQILERAWWRLDRAMEEACLRAAARLYVSEALLCGTTTLVDHHESPQFIEGSLDILADACEELGIRALLCYGATERNGGREEARRGLGECRRLIESNRRPLVRGLVGLHASFTVSDDTIREAGDLCREQKTVLHVHVAEDLADVKDAKRRGYEGPLERLVELEGLLPGSILAHGVHLNETQVGRAASENTWLVQNPRSNRGNGVGYPLALSASHRVALGTDGYPADMLTENRELLELSKDRGDVEARAAANRLDAGLSVATERFGGFFGRPEEGTMADLIVVDEKGEGSPLPRHVIVGGRVVVKDRVLETGGIDEIRTKAEKEAERLWKRMEAL